MLPDFVQLPVSDSSPSCRTAILVLLIRYAQFIRRPPFLAPHLQEQMTSQFQTKPSRTTKMTLTIALLRLLPPEGLLFLRTSHLFPIWPTLRLFLLPLGFAGESVRK